jgi:hypothetical protein
MREHEGMTRLHVHRRSASVASLRLGPVIVALVWLAACTNGGPGDQEVTVRPFEEVQGSDIVFESDPSDPSRAIFRVTTTEPMICAIVWGEDESFGRFNNSLSMNGTGIEQHDVVLPDVEPGREYRFVVQGTTADGTLYRSEVATFSVDVGPEAAGRPEQRDRGPNLASGAEVVAVSSTFSAAFGAQNALDGDTSTEWATDGDGDRGSITVDLGSEQEIGGVEFLTRSMADGTSITEMFTVTIDDGASFGPFPAGAVADPRFSEVAARGRQLRFDVVRSTGGNVGAVEIRVFGPQA